MKKVLIFDFDGVFYSGDQKFNNVASHVNNNRRKFLPHITDEQYNEICKEFPEWLNTVSGAEITDCIYKIKEKYPSYKISTEAFWDWQQEDIYPLIIDFGQVVNANYMEQLCKEYPVYVVSNSSPNHIHFYMKKLDVKPEWFKQIFSNRFEEFDRSKKHYYQEIINLEQCDSQNVYVYGDSVKSDLEPGKQLGVNTFHITNSNDIERIVNSSLSIGGNMTKTDLIKKYLTAKSLADGYFNMNNPNFNHEKYNNLMLEVSQLKNNLNKLNISDQEIIKVQKEMEENGSYFER